MQSLLALDIPSDEEREARLPYIMANRIVPSMEGRVEARPIILSQSFSDDYDMSLRSAITFQGDPALEQSVPRAP